MATYNTGNRWVPWVLIASLLIVSGYMDAKDAKLMERTSVQVAQE